MLNENEVQQFYINSKADFFTAENGFTPEALIENDKELDGLEILFQTVKQHKIDPWNIDLSDIADKYMQHLAESKSNNLRVTGRAFFFLAMLLKMKSNVLVGIDPIQFEPEPEVNPEFDDNDNSRFNDDMYFTNYYPDNVIPLEDIIQRRMSVKQNRKRLITLRDLIRQLEFYEKLDAKERIESRNKRVERRVRDYSRMTSADIVNMAQEEYIEKSMAILSENLPQILKEEEKVGLDTLALLGLDKVSAYIGMLFLSRDTDYELIQKDFYSDVYVRKTPAELSKIEEETAAAL